MKFPTLIITAGLLTVGHAHHHTLRKQQHHRALLDQDEACEMREELREYFQNKRDSMDIDEVTVTESGNVIDCVDQPNYIEDPPYVDKLPSSYDDWDKREKFELEPDNAAGHCHGGDVPCLRRDLMADWLSKHELKDIDDFLCHYGDVDGRRQLHESHPIDLVHKFAGVKYEDNEPYHGVEGYMSINLPYVADSEHGEYSGAFMSVVNDLDDQHSEQRIEVGWQVNHALYADEHPHLYVFYTKDHDETRGDGRGGYNLDVAGFVQTSHVIFPGDRLLDPSFPGDDQYSMYVRIEYKNGDWWVRINDEYVGYYPRTLVMGQHAHAIQMGGEVRLYDDGLHSETDMGSGELAEDRWTNAAYIRHIKIIPDSGGSDYDPGDDLIDYTINIGDDDCYSVFERFNSGNDWDTYFYYGGPGKASGCSRR